jgi:hypothetical protein
MKPRGINSKAFAIARLERRIQHSRTVLRAKRRSTRPGDLVIVQTHQRQLEQDTRALEALQRGESRDAH